MIRGTVTYIAPPDVLARELKSGLKEGLQAMIEHWHSHMLPGHFERPAHNKYGYAKRSPKWNATKARRTSQSIDLVYTGRLKREACRSIRVSGTVNKAQGVLDVPKYAYMWKPHESAKKTRKEKRLVALGIMRQMGDYTGMGRGSNSFRNYINKADEMLRITDDEIAQLAVELDRRLGETLNKTRETRTLTP